MRSIASPPIGRFLVIVPAFNEEATLPHVLADLASGVSGMDLLVVDDGSTDRTHAIATARGIRVVRHRINLSYGAAVKTGLLYAVDQGYHAAVLFDADGQHEARHLADLVAPVLSGRADVVIGSRYLGSDSYRGSWLRRLGTATFSGLLSLAIGQRITDVTSGFRAMGARSLAFFAAQYPTEFPEIETLLLAARAGLTIAEVPVSMRQRMAGTSFHTLSSGLLWPSTTLLSMLVTLLRRESLGPEEAWR